MSLQLVDIFLDSIVRMLTFAVALVIFILLIGVLYWAVRAESEEGFRTKKYIPIPSYLLLSNPHIYNLVGGGGSEVVSQADWPKLIESIFNNGKLPASYRTGRAGPDVGIVVDAVDAKQLALGGFKESVALPVGCFVGVASRELAYHMECGFDFKNRRIGYLTGVEKHMAHAIVKGYRLQEGEYSLEQVPIEDWGRIDSLIRQCRYDIVLVYLLPGSEMQSIIGRQDVSVFGFKGIDMDRIRVFYPGATVEEVNLAYMFQGRNQVMAREKVASLICAPQYAVRVYGRGVVDSSADGAGGAGDEGGAGTEPFINRLVRTEDGPEYSCYGDATLQSRALCNSPTDVIGAPRQQEFPSVWDKPCKGDTDCPFFEKGRKAGENGGCGVDGTCQFPVGVKRLGWRKYTDAPPFHAFCLGCGPDDSPDCCKGNYIYPSLK